MTAIICFAACASAVSAQTLPADGGMVYLENKHLRAGFLRSSGGALAHLSAAGAKQNLLNHFDRGRLVQQSYYGDSDGSLWAKTPWRYNPVQGGDYHGKGARVLEWRQEPAAIYAKTVPLHWATGAELKECVMEQWITLHEHCVHARYRFTYDGHATHTPRHQEIPALFADPSLDTLVTYSGAAPWTGGDLERRTPGQKNEYLKITENWAAWIGPGGTGLGIYVPAAAEATCYRFAGGAGSDCSYVAPITTFALKPGLKFTYDAWLATGTPEQLRAQFAVLRRKLPPP